MRFIPHTEGDVREMLAALGASSVDDLFHDVPEELRRQAGLSLPLGRTEHGVRARVAALASRNTGAFVPCFLGAGAYRHFSPAIVDHVIQRAEYYSAYTPYQPEVSQGTLQATFEFQTLIAILFGLDVANASMYDGASATAEAVLMARRILPQRRRVLVSRALHPQYVATVRSYLEGAIATELVEIPWGEDGRIDAAVLDAALDDDTAAVIVGYPNGLGIIEDVGAVAQQARRRKALTVTVTPEPLALAALRSPGDLGADIAVGEGQSFGIPLSYGGPGLGLFASRAQYTRSLPGRLVGETVDSGGRRAFVLTLATREQHIRREKATSNICTNHALMALAAAVYLCTLGRAGLRALAAQNLATAHRLAARLCASGKWRARFAAPWFNEFVLQRSDARQVIERAYDANLIPGLELGRWFPDLDDCLMICATEMHGQEEVDRLVEVLS